MFDFLVMAQCENISLGVTLTDSQQKQPSQQEKGDKSVWETQSWNTQKALGNVRTTLAHLPIHLALLVDDAMGLLSGDSAVEPQLSYMNDYGEDEMQGVKTLFWNKKGRNTTQTFIQRVLRITWA